MRLFFIAIIFFSLMSPYIISEASAENSDRKRVSKRYHPESDKSDYIKVKFYPQYRTVGGLVDHKALLQVDFADGWHGYWKYPGESGLAPVFDYDDSRNIAFIQVNYPAPIRYEIFGIQNLGYKRQVNFPLNITVLNPKRAAIIDLKMSLMVCRNVCVPQDLHINVKLEASEELDPTGSEYLIRSAFKKLPKTENNKYIGVESAMLSKGAIILSAYSSQGFDGVDFFVEKDNKLLSAAKPHIMVSSNDKRRANIKIDAPPEVGAKNIAMAYRGKKVKVTMTRGSRFSIEREFTFD